MSVFVTGGTGFIGSSVVRELRARAHVVRALVRDERKAEKIRALGIEPVIGDLSDVDLLVREAAQTDAVVHAAFAQAPDAVDLERTALEAMIDALRPSRAFVYTSGVWVYGSRGDAVVAEDAPLNPLALVAWRPAHEQLVLAQQGRLRAVVVRPGIVYGDGGGIPGMMVEQARNGTLRIIGDGANRWPTVRHDALAELYGAIVDRPSASGVYNASRGASVPYAEIAHAASRAAGKDGAVDTVPIEDARTQLGAFADALASDLQIDSGRAARELGWEPHRPTLLEEFAATALV